MGDAVLSLLALVVLVALGCLVFALVAVVPFVRGVDMAERRGFSADRWGALCLLGVALGLGLAVVVHGHGGSKLLYGGTVLLAWSGPAALALLAPGQRVGGLQGTHER